MKLLVTVPWSERLGGAENMLWNFLRHLDSARGQVVVVFHADGPFASEAASLPGVRSIVMPTGRLRQPHLAMLTVARLARLISRESPDLIVSWAAKTHIYASAAAQLAQAGDRVVWWQHAIPNGHWLERLATLMPARAVGCSSQAAALAQTRMWPRRAVFVVNPGIEPDAVRPIEKTGLRIPEGRVVIGICGRLQPWKGQHRFVQAVDEVLRRGHDVHGLIVGGDAYGLSPEYSVYLDGLIRERRLEDRITMTGHVRDPRAYVSVMDILVNASVAEPFGITTIEGLAQQVAVIAARDGGAADIIEDGESGILVERAEASVLADAIERLVADPAQRTRLANAGRARFLDRFTAAQMTAGLTREFAAYSRSAERPALV